MKPVDRSPGVTVTAVQIRDQMLKLADEIPDYVVPSRPDRKRFYLARPPRTLRGIIVENERYACIVGLALTELGVNERFIEIYEGQRSFELLAALGLSASRTFSDEDLILDWIDRVQKHQDLAEPWWNAVRLANKEIEHIRLISDAVL